MISDLLTVVYLLGVPLAWLPLARLIAGWFADDGMTAAADRALAAFLGLIGATFWPLSLLVAWGARQLTPDTPKDPR